jgi:DNA-binding ferritin-like protein
MSETSTDLSGDAVVEISNELRELLADVFALYVKTKNFHWHMSGPHFRDYHLLLDEHGAQIFAMTDDIAERARKIGGLQSDPSAMSRSINGSRTTTTKASRLRACWLSFARITWN